MSGGRSFPFMEASFLTYCFSKQWLHSARTCPVCRGKISPKKRPVSPQPVAGPSNTNRPVEDDEDSDDRSPSPIDPAILAAISASYSRELI